MYEDISPEEHWEKVAATPWHKRDLLSVDELLTPPVSRWGRAIYWALLPVVFVVLLAFLELTVR